MSAKTVDEDGCSCVDLVKVYGIVTCWVISISNKGQRFGFFLPLIGKASTKLFSHWSVEFTQNPTARCEESTEHGQEIIPHLNNFVNVHFLFCILLCIALLAWAWKLFVFTLPSFRQILYFEYSTPNVECCTKVPRPKVSFYRQSQIPRLWVSVKNV